MVKIQVSVGELIDKLSILLIKLDKVKDKNKLKLIKHEFDLLYNSSAPYLENSNVLDLYPELVKVNTKLWEVEDKLRVLEKEGRFDAEFINLARQVYYINDERFELKNKINSFTNSEIREIKEYVNYKSTSVS